MRYVQGFLIPVPHDKKAAYREMAEQAAPFFQKNGATRIVECWGDNIQDGKVTDFRRAVKAEKGENVVFSWIEWPDKETCDAAHEKMMSDESMTPPADMPFDGERMVFGGFEPIFETES